MPTVNPSPIGNYGDQFVDNNGNPLSGGKLYTFDAGTTTPRSTWTTIQGDVLNTNPIVLGTDGRVQSEGVWLEYGYAYKFVLYTSADVLVSSWDNVIGVVDGPEGATPLTETTAQYTYNAAATAIPVDDSDAFAVGCYAVITDGTNRTSGYITAKATNSLTFQPLAVLPPGDAGSGTVYAIGSSIAVAGPQGATGEDVAWLTGAGAPAGGTGEDGDMYLNTLNGDVYGPKAAGAWGSPVCNIMTAWLTGSGAPGGGTGENGDMYLNISNGDVYGPKAAGAWGSPVCNITGPAANLSDSNALALAASAGPGVSSLASRYDHVHPFPTAANVGALALSVVTALGDLVYATAAGVIARLAGNTGAVQRVLTQTGNGTISAAPAWAQVKTEAIETDAVSSYDETLGTGAFSANSTSWQDVTGVVINNFVHNGGDLILKGQFGGISGSAGIVVYMGVNIDSTDYLLNNGLLDGSTGFSSGFTGERRITGLAAGTYTIQLRVKLSSGTASINASGWGLNRITAWGRKK